MLRIRGKRFHKWIIFHFVGASWSKSTVIIQCRKIGIFVPVNWSFSVVVQWKKCVVPYLSWFICASPMKFEDAFLQIIIICRKMTTKNPHDRRLVCKLKFVNSDWVKKIERSICLGLTVAVRRSFPKKTIFVDFRWN